jgi:hypothetical protein
MRWVTRAIAAACVLAAANAQAQTTEPAPAPAEPAAVATEPPPAPTTLTIPAGTTIVVEFAETLSSRTTQTGQLVGLRLAEPLVVDGHIIAEPGAAGGGEVIDAARSGMGGRSGKLIVSGRYVEVGGQRARIRGLQVMIAGEDNSREAVNTMILVPYVGWMGGFIQGGEIEIPAGTRAAARFATNIVVPMPATAPVAAEQTAAVTPEQTSGVEDTQ